MVPQHKAHPWHGLAIGKECPEKVTAFIEIVPSDTIKYEIDKESGFLKVDRPQKYSNITPTLYGFIPQTYCGTEVAKQVVKATDHLVERGDGDPLDICVLCEKNITHAGIILKAIPIGGIRLVDRGEADDKIIAVMEGDGIYGVMKDLKDCPQAILERLKHYFLTYKNLPGEVNACEIQAFYGKETAYEIINKSRNDYAAFVQKHSE